MRLVLIGPPASGKGTQGELLAAHFAVPHISTGQMIRALVESGNPGTLLYKRLIERGNFIPDADMVKILESRLEQPDAGHGYVLDGFPRDLAQAELFDKTTAGEKLDAAIELRMDESVVMDRISGRLVCPVCGTSYHKSMFPPRVAGVCDRDGAKLERRADDEPESVIRRMAVYRDQTEPLLGHYTGQKKLITVEASLSPDEVFRRLVGLLSAKLPESQNAKV